MNSSQPIDFLPITNIGTVDLTRHALIEASAGTGKTYTIETLVVRLLMEEADLNLENILLVTFTEKATGELKQRIRQKIELTLDSDRGLNEAVRKKLEGSLDGFDNAAIFTIHGFCHTLLKELPFETGNLFRQELIDDGPLFEKLLREQIRTDWPNRYPDRLEDLLGLADFSADPDGFVTTTVDLAQRLHGDPDRETVIPDPEGLDVERLWQSARESVLTLKALVGTPPDFSNAYGRLNINARSKAAVMRDVVIPLEQALVRLDDQGRPLAEVLARLGKLTVRQASGVAPIDRLMPENWLKAGENLRECPHLAAVTSQLNRLGDRFMRLSHALMLASMLRLRRDARDIKARNGWISYQDMLTQVAEVVANTENREALNLVRSRYRVAFVDEFQDTDDLQWRIFSTLFLCPDRLNRLFLIGDPKQAIYAFRGADVFTYLAAKQQMIRLSGRGLANLYDLRMNWRSVPPLVASFNRVFSREAWFGDGVHPGAFEIGYPQVDSPDADRLSMRIVNDDSRRPAFNVVDLTEAGRHGIAKSMLAGFICREIRFLVDTGRIRIDDGKGRVRPLNFGDIAVLVRSQSEFNLLEPLLGQWSIPYVYYRKPGLFQCRQAHWLSMVLKAVCRPMNAAAVRLALLTPFFDVPPASLLEWPDLPDGHRCQRLIDQWHAQAQQRRWGSLFGALMDASGMTFRHCTDPDWDRTQANFQQIFDFLEVAAYTRNLDIGGLIALLDQRRRSDDGTTGSDADIHQIEDEGDKVQILTMHVSKGLEFPVVFIAGGITTRSGNGLTVYHAVDPDQTGSGCRKVIDLTGKSGREQARKENEDENRRLYYVALTRARAKLYVPYYPDSQNHGWVGPICRFVSASISEAFGHEAGEAPPAGWHPAGRRAIAPASGESTRKEIQPVSGALGEPLLPEPVDFRSRNAALESFSSINHRMHRGHHASGTSDRFSLLDLPEREADEPPGGAPMEEAEMDALPGGTRVGSMLHYIFEHIEFQRVMTGPADILSDDALRRVIETACARYRIDTRWSPHIARIIVDSLRSPIQVNRTRLVLGDLSPNRRRHEIEFYFPLAEPSPDRRGGPGCFPFGDLCRERVVRGVIDMIFEWQGRFYIADWKSNRLAQGYHQDAMAQEMAAAGYELQAQLYSVATLRWLEQRMAGGFDPKRHFGGVVYLFIRGMGGKGDGGVFHIPAERLLPLEALQDAIQRQIGKIRW